MLPRELLLPRRTVSGPGKVLTILNEAAVFGDAGVLVHGRSLANSGVLHEIIGRTPARMRVDTYVHGGHEPTVGEVDKLRGFLKKGAYQWMAAVGGGSVMDLAKAAAALLPGDAPTSDYQRGLLPVPGARLPLLMAPSTAGTGSEATVVAVLTDPKRRLKASIRHATMMPETVILDRDLLRTCSPAIIASSGLDAFVQAVESYTSRHATEFTRMVSEQAIRNIAGSLQDVFHGDFSKAEALLEGSYLSGIALSHARLGLVHGLAHPLGARWIAPHGLVCALCLPAVMEFNSEVCAVHMRRLRSVLRRPVESLVAKWLKTFDLPNVFHGESVVERGAIIRETLESGSTKANPRDVGEADVSDLLDTIFKATRA